MNKENIYFLLTFALTFIIFGFRAQYQAALDTVPAQVLPVSILEEGNLDFNEFKSDLHENRYWYQEKNGKLYSSYSIIPGLLNVPVFAVAKIFGAPIQKINKKLSLYTCLILTALTIAFHFLIANFFFDRPFKSAAFALLFGLGTAYWSVNSRGLWEHTPAVLFLSIALYLLLQRKPEWSGFFIGWAVFSRPILVIFALTITIYVIMSERRYLKRYLLLAAIPGVTFAAYNYFYLESILAPFFSNARNVSQFNYPSISAFLGLIASPARGLLVYSPFMYIAILPIKFIFTNSFPLARLMRFIVIGIALQLLLLSSWSNWWGGHSFSYRLLIDLLPLLFILICFHYSLYDEDFISPLERIFFAVAVFIHGFGAYLMPCGANQKLDIDKHPENLWVIPDSEIVSCSRKALAEFLKEVPIEKE